MHHNNRQINLNHYIIQWNTQEYQVDLISGTGIHHAFTSSYHKDSFQSIKDYEQVFPVYFNLKLSNGDYLPFTIFASKSGYGMKIRWIKGIVNREFKALIAEKIQKTYFKNEQELMKNVTPLFYDIYDK